jgi:thiol:disulfide interchange protein DsbD
MAKSFFLMLFFLSLSVFQNSNAQNHVVWEARFDRATSEIVITASIDKGWHLYSINNPEDLGPVPTHIAFDKMKGLKLIGKTIEQEPINAFDPNFGTNVAYHEKKVEFRQKVKIKKLKQVRFKVFYMVCDDSQCLPPIEVALNVEIQ